MEIKKTNDYDLFKIWERNRPTGSKSVDFLVKSIEKIDLTIYKPIIVDKDFRIIDGQHRYFACLQLGKPIYYIKMEDGIDADEAMLTLNSYQKNWRQEDYLNYHAKIQGGRWQGLKEFEEYYRIGLYNSMVIYSDNPLSSSDIKKGTREFTKSANADRIAEYLLSEPIINLRFGKSRPFVLAVKKAFEKYDDRQLVKLRKKMIYLQMSANYEQYLIAFDNLLR